MTLFLIVFEKEFLSVSTKRQKEIDTLQDVITSLTVQLRKRDKQIEELKQSLKGNWIKLIEVDVCHFSL